MLESSGIPNTSSHSYTFRTFKNITGTEKAQEAAQVMATGAAPFKVLLIYGDVGCGKTHLLYAAATLAIENGLRAKFIAFPDLLSKARMNIGNRDGGGIDSVLDEYKKCEFLCLDEVKFKLNKDGQSEDQWATDVLEDILNYRYRYELYTMITTNHDIKAFPAQVYSRLTEPRICKFVLNSAPDYRPRVKK
jgi:DNA replication protein DnaC